MKKILAFLMITLCLTVGVSADGVNKRVKFARGKSSSVISGAVVRGDRAIYTIGAKAKQKMMVKTRGNATYELTVTVRRD